MLERAWVRCQLNHSIPLYSEDSRQALVARFAIAVSLAIATALALIPGPAMALVGGVVDTGGTYRPVVAILGGPGRFCSATKIGPRQFLTAGHCVVDKANGELFPTFRRNARLAISNAPIPRAGEHFVRVNVEQTHLPPTFEQGLLRFITYKQARIANFSNQLIGTELRRRIENLQADHHFTAKFPDAAVITVQTDTPEIPQAQVDLDPLRKGDPVTLVGYGCDD